MRIALLMSRTAVRYLNKRRWSKGATQHLVSQGDTVHHYLPFGLQKQSGWMAHVESFVGEREVEMATKLRNTEGVDKFPHIYCSGNHSRAKFVNQNWPRLTLNLRCCEIDFRKSNTCSDGSMTMLCSFVMIFLDHTFSIQRQFERGHETDYPRRCARRAHFNRLSGHALVERLFNSALYQRATSILQSRDVL